MKTGGPAFPIPLTDRQEKKWNEARNVLGDADGMTLRDYFAAKAMQGLIASPRGTPNGADATTDYYAMLAYAMADAMLEARGEE